MFQLCDCGGGESYAACCGRLHLGAPAPDAATLMRSRYCAFARGDVAYLLKSWAAETRPPSLVLDPEQSWTGLKILDHRQTGPETATVRFVASWRKGARKGRLRETSRFRREGAGWVYIDGDLD